MEEMLYTKSLFHRWNVLETTLLGSSTALYPDSDEVCRPYVLFRAVFMLPLVGDAASTGLWFLGVMFTGMIYTVDFRLRNPGDSLWLYRPIFTLLTAFVYTWLLPYAAETIKNKAWR
jgi:hyaluronan synthase